MSDAQDRLDEDGQQMTPRPFEFIEIIVSESIGEFGDAGAPELFLRYSFVQLPWHDSRPARVTILKRRRSGRSWNIHEAAVSLGQSSMIARALESLGIPGRDLDVSGKADTSNVWHRTTLSVRSDCETFHLDIDRQCSGLEGADAEELGRLFQSLVGLSNGAIEPWNI